MRVAWVQDIDPMTKIGGAQLNDAAIIEYGIAHCGARIDIVTPQNADQRVSEQYDLVVLSNCVSFKPEWVRAFVKGKKYVVFAHDYYFCKWRLYFPGKMACGKCAGFDHWKELHKGAALNIFLSPLHHSMHTNVFGEEVLGRKVCIPSAIDTEFWNTPPQGVSRVPGSVLSVHGLLPFKGRAVVADYVKSHPEMRFTFVGSGGEPLDFPNCFYVPFVGREELKRLYAQHEFVMLLPDTAQPFERVAAEAYLSGAKIIHNDLVGFFSYPWDFKDCEGVKNYLRQAAAGFWDEIYALEEKK